MSKKTFKLHSNFNGYTIEHLETGLHASCGDGVDESETHENGTPEFIQEWEDNLNSNTAETLEAYFPQIHKPEKPKSTLTVSQSIKLVKDLQGTVRYIYQQAFEACSTHEQILGWINDKVYGHYNWKRLPRWAMCEVSGYMECLRQQHWNKLVWTHILPLDRINSVGYLRLLSGDDRFEGRYGEIETAQSAHCYAVSYLSVTRYIPFSEDDRKKDLGMTAETLTKILSLKERAMLVPVNSVYNGTAGRPTPHLVNYYR